MKENDAASPRDISTTFSKGMSVLKAFDLAHPRLSLSDIARACDFDRAVARRLALTLEHLGYLRRDGRLFSLTPKVLVLAGGFLQSRQFGKLIQPTLEVHSRSLGQTISLAVIDEDSAVYVAQASADPTRISFGFTIGSRLPLLQTAIGRALVTCCDEEETARLVAHCELRAFTEASVLDRAAIGVDIERSRALGHTLVRGEFEPGVNGLAVPVSASEDMVSAVGVSVPNLEFDDRLYDKALHALRSCRDALAPALR